MDPARDPPNLPSSTLSPIRSITQLSLRYEKQKGFSIKRSLYRTRAHSGGTRSRRVRHLPDSPNLPIRILVSLYYRVSSDGRNSLPNYAASWNTLWAFLSGPCICSWVATYHGDVDSFFEGHKTSGRPYPTKPYPEIQPTPTPK